MEILGIIGVFIGILLIIWFSVKGLHIIIAAPLSALVVMLCFFVEKNTQIITELETKNARKHWKEE